jgi:pyroglutamyl-peptidase
MTSSTDDDSTKQQEQEEQPAALILTGFGPFGDMEENPSTILVNEIPSYLQSSSDAWKQQLATRIDKYIVLETSTKGVCQTLDALAAEEEDETNKKPKILLHLGVNYRGTGFQLEQCAYNDATFRIPDQRGYQPQKMAIVLEEDVGSRCDTTLNVETLVQNQTSLYPNVESKISIDPGRFVCNYLYCYSLNKLQSPHVQCLFLHIPNFSVVSKETQLAYCSDLMRQLANISRDTSIQSS